MYRNKEREIRKQKNIDFHCDPYRNEEEVRKQRNKKKWKVESSQLKRRNMETKK